MTEFVSNIDSSRMRDTVGICLTIKPLLKKRKHETSFLTQVLIISLSKEML